VHLGGKSQRKISRSNIPRRTLVWQECGTRKCLGIIEADQLDSAGFDVRRIRTGHCASRTTFSVTEPKTMLRQPVMP
jgi:hypothetical protein